MEAIWTVSSGQGEPKENSILKLEDQGKEIENTILLEISDYDNEILKEKTGLKVDISARNLVINGDTAEPEEITTRGQSTLQFKRKSLGLKLNTTVKFNHGEKEASLKKFSLLNLAMDKYYVHNRLAFGMMEATGLFRLFYSYCELRINGRSEGIYMITQRPEDWALSDMKSPLVIRRGYNHRIEKIRTDSKTEKADAKKYTDFYRQIYRSLEKHEGEELYRVLSEWIDLENYMKWLAFNYLVRNGDYSDEVFFYIDPDIKKFRIIPWDYDDIFATVPHEVRETGKKATVARLLFSTEDILDKKIASDKFLYSIYLGVLKDYLEELTPLAIKNDLENCFGELFPYYSDREIISNSQYDLFKDANLENLKMELMSVYLGLNGIRTGLIESLSETGK